MHTKEKKIGSFFLSHGVVSSLLRNRICRLSGCTFCRYVICFKITVSVTFLRWQNFTKCRVQDVNDHAPSFRRRSVAVTLTRCRGEPTVRLPAAEDRDAGPPPTYRVLRSPVAVSLEVVRLFDGSQDLRLRLNGAELARRRSASLQIDARDHGDPPLSDTLQVSAYIMSHHTIFYQKFIVHPLLREPRP